VPPRELWLEDLIAKAPVAPTVVAALVSSIAETLGEDGRTLRGTRFVLEGRKFHPVSGEAPANMPAISSNEALGQVTFELLTGKRWHKGQLGYTKASLVAFVTGEPAGEAVADVCDGLLVGTLTVTAAKMRTEALSALYRVDLTRRLDDIAAGRRNQRVDHPEQSTGAFPAGFLTSVLAAPSATPTAVVRPVPEPTPIPVRSRAVPFTTAALLAASIVVFFGVIIGGLVLAIVVHPW
jgi:hypothetical protein